MRRLFLASVFVGLAAAATTAGSAACTTDYQKGLNDPNFGDPNALAGQKQPGASSELSTSTTEAGPISGSPFVCVTNGGTLLDGGPCAVSFKTDVLGALGKSTCTTTSCHGGLTPPNPPRIEPSDPGAMYPLFAGFKMSTGNLPYINPCSTDKTKSGLACNLYATGACGVKMPQGGTPQMDQADIDKIEQWLACGSPNN